MATWFGCQARRVRIFCLMLRVWIQMRFTKLARHIDPKDLKGWMPVFIKSDQCQVLLPPRVPLQMRGGYIRDGYLVWLNLNGLRLTAPWLFYDFAKTSQVAVTNINFLTKIQKNRNSLSLMGFIFHIGRCGSTLLKNMLTKIPENLVLAEPDTINQILYACDESVRVPWLRGVINAMGQAYTGSEKHYFIKFTSIAVVHINFIRQVFPGVPSLFLYRDPIEVINSALDGAVMWMSLRKSYPEIVEQATGIASPIVKQLSPEEYAARVIGHYYNNVLQEAGENVLLVNYNRLSEEACLREILSFFQVEISNSQIDCMLKALEFYSKDPSGRKRYKVDTARKKQASRKVTEMAEKWAIGPYERLEALARSSLLCS